MAKEKFTDDCDWNIVYPEDHKKQTYQFEVIDKKSYDLPDDYNIINNKLYNVDKMHEQHILLLETILEKKPLKVFEVGFGYANHLSNIQKLLPNVEINGCDISYLQKTRAIKRYPNFTNSNLIVGDFLSLNIPNQQFDFVFSQAVLMHMSTAKAKQAIYKMCRISKKWVMSIDRGLAIPNLAEFLHPLGKVTLLDWFAKLHNFDTEYEGQYNARPFIIEVMKCNQY